MAPKSGFQIKGGKITMFTPDGDVHLTADYVIGDMKKAIAQLHTGYAAVCRTVITMIQANKLEPAMAALKFYFGCKERQFQIRCRQWYEQLNILKMFKNIKTAPEPATEEVQNG